MGTGLEQKIVLGAAPTRDRGIVATALASLPDAQRAMLAWPAAAPAAPPKPSRNALGDRALAYLRDKCVEGAEIATSALATALDSDLSTLRKALERLPEGSIYARKVGGKGSGIRGPGGMLWSLVDHSKKNGCASAVSPAGDGSQTPNGGRVDRPVKAGSDTSQQGANRDASAEQSHGAEGSASPTGRGADGPSARGAAPVSHYSEGRDAQQVLKAEAARPDATDRATPAMASPRVGAMGTGQPADAGPAGGASKRRLDALVPGAHALAKRAAARAEQGATAPTETGSIRIALWSDGELQIRRPGGHAVVFTREETRQLVAYLDSIALDGVREAA